MTIPVSVEFSGVPDLEKNLRALAKEVTKAQRRGVTKAGRILRARIKQLMPKASGLARRRLVSIVKTYRGGSIQAIVGVEKSAAQTVTLKRPAFRLIKGKLRKIPKPAPERLQVRRNPAKILHLLELGFTRKDGRQIPAVAPMRRGHSAVKGEMEAVIVAELKQAMES